jgi:hypothetical protein
LRERHSQKWTAFRGGVGAARHSQAVSFPILGKAQFWEKPNSVTRAAREQGSFVEPADANRRRGVLAAAGSRTLVSRTEQCPSQSSVPAGTESARLPAPACWMQVCSARGEGISTWPPGQPVAQSRSSVLVSLRHGEPPFGKPESRKISLPPLHHSFGRSLMIRSLMIRSLMIRSLMIRSLMIRSLMIRSLMTEV